MNITKASLLLSILICLQSVSAKALLSYSYTEYLGDTITMVVDEEATFPGGQESLYQHIAQHLKYPKGALTRGIEGMVYLRFIVERDGRLTDIKVIKSDSPGLDQAAIDAITASPRWIPAKVKGEPVRTIHVLPVQFKLAR